MRSKVNLGTAEPDAANGETGESWLSLETELGQALNPRTRVRDVLSRCRWGMVAMTGVEHDNRGIRNNPPEHWSAIRSFEVSHMIADLEDGEKIEMHHMVEAMNYRALDRKLFG